MERLKALVTEKCRVRGIKFNVEGIFDETKLAEAGRYWETGLRDLVSRLPDFDSIIAELKESLKNMKASQNGLGG